MLFQLPRPAGVSVGLMRVKTGSIQGVRETREATKADHQDAANRAVHILGRLEDLELGRRLHLDLYAAKETELRKLLAETIKAHRTGTVNTDWQLSIEYDTDSREVVYLRPDGKEHLRRAMTDADDVDCAAAIKRQA